MSDRRLRYLRRRSERVRTLAAERREREYFRRQLDAMLATFTTLRPLEYDATEFEHSVMVVPRTRPRRRLLGRLFRRPA